MKRFNKINYLAAFLLLTAFIILQSTLSFADPDKNKVSKAPSEGYREFVQSTAEPVSGFRELMSRIEYPKVALYAQIEGDVLARAYVDENGDVEQVDIIKGLGAGCDEEVVKAIEDTRFNPGKFNGKAVKSVLMIPVKFRLHDGN